MGPIIRSPSDNSTFFKDWQPSNALSLIIITFSEIFISVKDWQSSNAFSLITITCSDNFTSVKARHFANTLLPKCILVVRMFSESFCMPSIICLNWIGLLVLFNICDNSTFVNDWQL